MKRKALFLDRDGVINREHGHHTTSLEAFEVLPGVPDALALAARAGHVIVVITNQSGIALGLYGHAEVEAMHTYLRNMLGDHGVELADVLYCPHHPSHGRCLCRKPGSLLLERAMARHHLTAVGSAMIGDRDRDVQAAAAVGVEGVLVAPNVPLLPVVQQLLSRA